MELSHESQEKIVDGIVKEFWQDMQDLTTDVAKDILLKVHGFSQETQLCLLIESIVALFTLEIARFTCILDSDTQSGLWNTMKLQAMEKSDGFKKIFKAKIQDALMGNDESL